MQSGAADSEGEGHNNGQWRARTTLCGRWVEPGTRMRLRCTRGVGEEGGGSRHCEEQALVTLRAQRPDTLAPQLPRLLWQHVFCRQASGEAQRRGGCEAEREREREREAERERRAHTHIYTRTRPSWFTEHSLPRGGSIPWKSARRRAALNAARGNKDGCRKTTAVHNH